MKSTKQNSDMDMNDSGTQKIEDARLFAESIVETIREPLLVLGKDLKVVAANPAFYRKFKAEEAETEGKRIYTLGNRQWDIPALRELLEKIIPENANFENFEMEHDFPDLGHRIMQLNARKLDQKGGKENLILLAIEDVTEQIESRRELEEAEARLRKFVEEINSIIIELNRNGEIRFSNRFTEKIFGYSRDELIGKNIVGTILPERDSQGTDNTNLIADLFRNPERYYFNESEGRTKDGEKIWISWSSRLFTDPENNETSILIDGNDMTPVRDLRRQAREAFNIVNASKNAILGIDTERTCRFANRAFAELVGKKAEAIEGAILDQTGLPEDILGPLNKAVDDAFLKKEDQAIEIAYDDRFVMIQVEPEYETDFKKVGSIIYINDITARKQTEEALRESEAKFRSVFEQSAIGMGRVSFTDARWIDVNDAFCSMLGYTREEMQATPWPDITHPEDVDLGLIPFRQMAAGDLESYSVEKRFIHKHGHYVWASLTLSMVRDSHGSPDYEIAIIEDITKRKKAEEALQHLTDTLEQQVVERTRLAKTRARQLQKLAMDLVEAEERERRRIANLLHDDLQQLLVGARMQVQSARDAHPAIDRLKKIEHLLTESIEKSRHLSHELTPPVLQHANLSTAVEWLANRMADQFGLHVRLETEAMQQIENAPLKVFLFRAVQELLFNTAKHAGVDSVQVVLSRNGDNLIIEVSDQGQGFIPEALSTSGKIGLGLTGLKERTRSIGGSLNIESAPGKGSRFTITVPLNLVTMGEPDKAATAAENRPTASIPPPSATRPKTRVLFADNHRVIRQGLISMVSLQPDIQVVGEAENGEEALESTRRLKPDVVIMDILMPKMDGVEATRHIKAELPGVRVIGLSMHGNEQIAKTMREAGAEAFVNKTASTEELLNAIYGTSNRI